MARRAAARLGAQVTFITKLGGDPFGDLARKTYAAEGIDPAYAFETNEYPTGAASVGASAKDTPTA